MLENKNNIEKHDFVFDGVNLFDSESILFSENTSSSNSTKELELSIGKEDLSSINRINNQIDQILVDSINSSLVSSTQNSLNLYVPISLLNKEKQTTLKYWTEIE